MLYSSVIASCLLRPLASNRLGVAVITVRGVLHLLWLLDDAQRGHNLQTASTVNRMLSSVLTFLIYFNSPRRLMSSAWFVLLCLTVVL
jgi:hypothetical protein